jgi:hypothetical protein
VTWHSRALNDSIFISSSAWGVFDVCPGLAGSGECHVGRGHLQLSLMSTDWRERVRSGALMPGSRVESWTVLDRRGVPAEPDEVLLGFLSGIMRQPNTVKAPHATDNRRLTAY